MIRRFSIRAVRRQLYHGVEAEPAGRPAPVALHAAASDTPRAGRQVEPDAEDRRTTGRATKRRPRPARGRRPARSPGPGRRRRGQLPAITDAGEEPVPRPMGRPYLAEPRRARRTLTVTPQPVRPARCAGARRWETGQVVAGRSRRCRASVRAPRSPSGMVHVTRGRTRASRGAGMDKTGAPGHRCPAGSTSRRSVGSPPTARRPSSGSRTTSLGARPGPARGPRGAREPPAEPDDVVRAARRRDHPAAQPAAGEPCSPSICPVVDQHGREELRGHGVRADQIVRAS